MRTSAWVLAAVAFLNGCVMAPYSKESFGPAKRFAVVSIYTSETIEPTSQQNASLSGLLKAMFSSDAGFSDKSDWVFAQTGHLVERAFGDQHAIRLVSAGELKSNPSYRAAPGDDPVYGFLWMKDRMRVAPGYKFFGSKESLAALAKRLRVDGVITARLVYSVAETKVGALGLAAGKHRAQTAIVVSAVDRDGRVLMAEQFMGEAKDSVGFVGDAVNFPKLRPMWVDSTQDALGKFKQRLASKA